MFRSVSQSLYSRGYVYNRSHCGYVHNDCSDAGYFPGEATISAPTATVLCFVALFAQWKAWQGDQDDMCVDCWPMLCFCTLL